MVEDTITIGIRWVRLAVQSCRPTVSEEASIVAEELYGGSVMPDASNLDPRVYSIHIGTRLLAVVNALDHLDGFSQSSRVNMRNLHRFPERGYKRNAILISMVDWWITGRMR